MKRFLIGAALAIAGAVLPGAIVSSASAAIPPAGVACATDGKINGRGASFALTAWSTFANGYRDDVCGPVAGGPNNTMAVYNYSGSQGTGSGQGQRATSCRSDAWGGTDIPYDVNTLGIFNGAPGKIADPVASGGLAQACPTAANHTPPFEPLAAPWPSASDVAANVMGFPVAGSSEVVGVQLPAAFCTGGPRPTSLSFTAAMVDALFSGEILNWNDPALRAGGVNANLVNCPGAVTRGVRSDRSGTTQIFKNYLKNVDPTNATCDPAETWSFLALDAQNVNWPTGGACSALQALNTNQGLAPACNTTAGMVCYLDLADAFNLAPTAIRASVRNATDTAFVSPSVGTTRANCNFGSVTVPGGSASGAVSLDPSDTWAFDNPSGNRGDVTQQGPGYPICGVTFALVYTGLADGTQANAIARLNANQRRTLYSYMSYVLSSAGQDRLNNNRYSSLPTSLVSTTRAGFQANF